MYKRAVHLILAAVVLGSCGAAWGQKKAGNVMPADGATDVAFPALVWTAGSTAVFHTVYYGTSPELGPTDMVAPRLPLGLTTYYYDGPLFEPGVTYYWRVDETERDLKTVITGDVWSFTVQAMTAYLPDPADGSNTVPMTVSLQWMAGQEAMKHHLYLSDDEAAVVDGTAEADKGELDDPNYVASELLPATTYFWRVDEINVDDTVLAGSVWSFTTVLPIDDFESYTDDVGERVFQTWIDGFGYTEPTVVEGNGTGAMVGYGEPPFAEQKTIHGGAQSMPMDYDNTGSPFYSEAERTWTSSQDWTLNGVDTLTLYVHGEARDFDVPMATASPVIDGKIDDLWAEASVQYINAVVDGQAVDGPKDCSGSFRVMYNSQYLYVLVDVNDETLVQDSDAAQGWLDDRIEVFLDPDNSGGATNDTMDDCQYCFRWNHAVVETPVEWYRSASSLPGVQYGVAATSTGYRHEIALPWSSVIGGPAPAGQLIRIDVMIDDDDDGGDRDSQLAWHGTAHVPDTWGTALIGGPAASEVDRMYVALQDASNRVSVVTYPDLDILTGKTWFEWNISLTDFSGVNLAAVRKMFIGVGDRVHPAQGGTGSLFIDDVYLTRPVPVEE
ncbi:MAG: hypothetical protein JW955_18950 [Sedimentisphaerales bacterium]|nr:hypothetical protein [Sedimentisphaerales bacterium]